MFSSKARLKRRIPELLAVFFNGLSNVVGVSGEKGLERYVFTRGGNVDIADDMADRQTNEWF